LTPSVLHVCESDDRGVFRLEYLLLVQE
jgi:hypothetical protein